MNAEALEDWRVHERRFESDPQDQDALRRAIEARRRHGMAVPLRLLESVVRPARTLFSERKLWLEAVRPDGRLAPVGGLNLRRGGARLAVPEHRVLVATPRRGDGGRAVAARALRELDVTGVHLAVAKSRRASLPIAGLPDGLEWLRASCVSVREREAEALSRHPGLAELWLDEGSFDLAALAALPSLVSLEAWCPAEPLELAAVARFPALERLTLWKQPVAVEDVRSFARGPALRDLRLVDARLMPETIEALGDLPHLVRLRIDGSPVRDLGRLGGLEALELESVGDTLDLYRAVARLPRLRELRLRRSAALDRECLEVLARGLPDIESLDVWAATTLEDASPLAGLARLRRLSLTNCWKLREAGAAPIGRIETLEALDLGQLSGLGDAGVEAIARLPRLARLSLWDTGVSAKGLAALAGQDTLHELHASGYMMNDAALDEIARLRGLRTLVLGPHRHSAAGLQRLLALEHLEDLYLPGAERHEYSRKALAPLTSRFRVHLLAGDWPPAF